MTELSKVDKAMLGFAEQTGSISKKVQIKEKKEFLKESGLNKALTEILPGGRSRVNTNEIGDIISIYSYEIDTKKRTCSQVVTEVFNAEGLNVIYFLRRDWELIPVLRQEFFPARIKEVVQKSVTPDPIKAKFFSIRELGRRVKG